MSSRFDEDLESVQERMRILVRNRRKQLYEAAGLPLSMQSDYLSNPRKYNALDLRKVYRIEEYLKLLEKRIWEKRKQTMRKRARVAGIPARAARASLFQAYGPERAVEILFATGEPEYDDPVQAFLAEERSGGDDDRECERCNEKFGGYHFHDWYDCPLNPDND